jgi:coenzyme F420-0:L-glutamate ligase/coenzyme F420-1:gamma-L-glutamate ligase
MAKIIQIIGLEKIGLIRDGDDIAQTIFAAASEDGVELHDCDVVVVSQKIVSKADGLEVDISKIKPSAKASALARRTGKDARLMELILRDKQEVLLADKQALIVRRKDGMICMNAGVDKSNVKGRHVYARLPVNSDAAANKIRVRLEELSGRSLAVIVGDTYSRPFRVGQVEFAIGVSGMEPVVDYRGLKDLFGYELRYKYVGLADEVAAAAELVMGQGTERTPVAILRGLPRLKRTEKHRLSRKLQLGRRKDLFHKIV